MEDINKIKIIHDLKENFKLNDELLNSLINQIEESKYKDNIDRFFRGYKVQDNFLYLFSTLPWVKNINGLEEKQLPNSSKKNYQVPDYIMYYETSNNEDKSLIFDVKSVKKEKEKLEIMSKQYSACHNYALKLNSQFLYAIYWEKIQTWTINSINNFINKGKIFKISLDEAYKNDLSIIIGDLTYFITKPIYRKSIIDKNNFDKSMIIHQKYGSIKKSYVSIDDNNYFEIEDLENAIIDSFIQMDEVKHEEINGDFILYEKSNNIYAFKLSNLILRHLAVTNIDLKKVLNGNSLPLISRSYIVDFMKKINAINSYMIPNTKTTDSDFLYNQAFEGSWVLEKYNL